MLLEFHPVVKHTLPVPAQINPGCMRSTIKAPVSAMKDQFRTRDGLDNSATIDKTQHRKKVRKGLSRWQRLGPCATMIINCYAAPLWG